MQLFDAVGWQPTVVCWQPTAVKGLGCSYLRCRLATYSSKRPRMQLFDAVVGNLQQYKGKDEATRSCR